MLKIQIIYGAACWWAWFRLTLSVLLQGHLIRIFSSFFRLQYDGLHPICTWDFSWILLLKSFPFLCNLFAGPWCRTSLEDGWAAVLHIYRIAVRLWIVVDKGCEKMEEEFVQVLPPRSDQATPRSKCSIKAFAMKKQQWMTAVGDSLLKGTEVPVCRSGPVLREVCCLPRVWIRNATNKLTSLVQPLDCCPLLLFCVGTNSVATRVLWSIKRDFRELRRWLKDSGAQVVFSLILPVMWVTLKETQAQDINTWLWDQCLCQNLGFYNCGRVFETQGLLGPDRIHLSW